MLIKDEYKLQIGDIVKFNGPDCQNVERKKIYDVVVKEVYSHWVLGEILNYEFNDDVGIRISMTNVDLVMQGIYNVEAIKENGFNVPVKEKLTDEMLKKMQEYNKTHNTKAKLCNRSKC